MRGFIATALGCAMLSGIGCAGSAKFIQQTPNGGVIELQTGANESEVRKLAQEKYGKDCAIEKIQNGSPTGNFDPSSPMGRAVGEQPTMWKVSKKTGTTPNGLPVAPDNGVMPAGYQQRAPVGGPMNNGVAPMSGMPTGTMPGATQTTGTMPGSTPTTGMMPGVGVGNPPAMPYQQTTGR